MTDPLWQLLARLAGEPAERVLHELLAEAQVALGCTSVTLSAAVSSLPSTGSELRVHVPGTTRHLITCWPEPPTMADIERARGLAAVLSLSLRLSDRERRAEHSSYHVTLGRAVAGVVHDIANPLTGLQVSLEAARDGFETDEALADALASAKLIRAATERLRRFARAADDGPTRLDVGEAIAAALRVTSFETRGLAEIVVRVTPGLFVRARVGELEHVLVNLVINSARALASTGGVQHRITLSAFSSHPDVILEVHDTGPGVVPEHVERVFDEGFTTKPSRDGSGLGLSICRDIITQLGGQITLDAPPGQGTRVTVRLPHDGSAEGEGRATKATLPTVLVIDGDPLVARGLKRALSGGAVVTTAGTLAEAAALVEAAPFDLVLCDHAPPRFDALAVRSAYARRWLGRDRGFLLLVVDVVTRLPPGTRVLAKPVDVAALKTVLAELVQSRW